MTYLQLRDRAESLRRRYRDAAGDWICERAEAHFNELVNQMKTADHSISGCHWEELKKIKLNLEEMASGEIKGEIKGLK